MTYHTFEGAWEEAYDKYNQYETRSLDCTITFDKDELKSNGWKYITDTEAESVSFDVVPIVQSDGTTIKRAAKVLKYGNQTLYVLNPVEFKNECVCESLI